MTTWIVSVDSGRPGKENDLHEVEADRIEVSDTLNLYQGTDLVYCTRSWEHIWRKDGWIKAPR